MLRGAPVDSVVAVYVEQGELVIPGVGTLRGRKAISDFLTPLTASVTVESVEMQIDSVTITGSSADERGRYRQVAGPKGGATQEFRGGFHATWTRGTDASGGWPGSSWSRPARRELGRCLTWRHWLPEPPESCGGTVSGV